MFAKLGACQPKAKEGCCGLKRFDWEFNRLRRLGYLLYFLDERLHGTAPLSGAS